MTGFNVLPLLPEMFLAITAMGFLMVGVSRGNESTNVISGSAIIAMVLALTLSLGLPRTSQLVLNDMFVFDQFAAFMKFLILVGLMASLAISKSFLEQQDMYRFEYPILIMFAGIGMMLMVSAHNMLSLYVALELQSLSLYVLAAFQRDRTKSAEAGIKYFILGALSSGMLLFGISLIYGFTGSLDFAVIADAVSGFTTVPLGVVFALVFILAGLAFKISAVPFHMWTPDVYEGAPTSVTALFAIVPKIAAFALLIRLVFGPFSGAVVESKQILYFLALSSMFVGAFAAIAQDNLKRIFAYSSIGHMGYALIGLVSGTEAGVGAVVFYLLVYMVMSAGVFAVVLCLSYGKKPIEKLGDLKALSRLHPGLAYALAILMFSMAGIPPLAGFFGKLVIFNAAIEQQLYLLAALGVLSSVVAAFYYIRIVRVMFFETDDAVRSIDMTLPLARKVVLAVSLAFVIGFIVKPSLVMDGAQYSVAVLFP